MSIRATGVLIAIVVVSVLSVAGAGEMVDFFFDGEQAHATFENLSDTVYVELLLYLSEPDALDSVSSSGCDVTYEVGSDGALRIGPVLPECRVEVAWIWDMARLQTASWVTPSDLPPPIDIHSPIAKLDISSGAQVGTPVRFDASRSVDPDGDPLVQASWQWDDGEHTTGFRVDRTFNDSSSYTVTLVITDSEGLERTVSETFYVRSERDRDGDGTADTEDGCPDDPGKDAPGSCGCGTSDEDSDADGTPDCQDACPHDASKQTDVDSDGDGVIDCEDGCLNNPAKTMPGICGCGFPDTDTDGDGYPDCIDQCPTNPLKVMPGWCGCEVPETDSDSDGWPDCVDACPEDPSIQTPIDTDGDGVIDCEDDCPSDPEKTENIQCPCGVPETDSDGDGLADCLDACPQDPDKVFPGVCGCGIADVDGDSDGVWDCNDGCPEDPAKTAPGICGCGVS
ncbi:thrombospondin type 3 repeat-containing protein, partial [Candidatus Bipolaricaulota bacterium]|nr:thrombospondin type 3 repeat-containing protein [Candidatus Bipolaricaulota bacterium]